MKLSNACINRLCISTIATTITLKCQNINFWIFDFEDVCDGQQCSKLVCIWHDLKCAKLIKLIILRKVVLKGDVNMTFANSSYLGWGWG